MMTRVMMFGALLSGCMVGEPESDTLSYEGFVAKYITVQKTPSGTTYLYDWDQPLRDEAQVKALYAEYARVKQGGERLSAAIVNTNLFGDRDVWSAADRTNLTYCVSNDFGANKPAVVNALAKATADWSAAANNGVKFAYDGAQDGACTNANTAVTFNTIPINQPDSGLIAQAFFPSYARADRQVLVNVPNALGPNPAFPFDGILRHELGHALGLRHETTRIDAAITYGMHCFEDVFFDELTAYDDTSVMVTPACVGNAIKNKQLVISPLDGVGIRALYAP